MAIEYREHADALAFMAPLSQHRAERLVEFLVADRPGTIVDLGCGWAELLLRALTAAPQARGIGIDTDAAAVGRALASAADRGLDDRVELLVGDAAVDGPRTADALLCLGASQIWRRDSAVDGPLDYSAALTALRHRVRRGGRVVYGDGIWSRPPTPEAIAPLGQRLDEFVALPELVELAVRHGFAPLAVAEADLDEWDEFESGYTARYAVWLAGHEADHPDADEVRERAARQRAAYLGGYRGVLGFAYLCLLAV